MIWWIRNIGTKKTIIEKTSCLKFR